MFVKLNQTYARRQEGDTVGVTEIDDVQDNPFCMEDSILRHKCPKNDKEEGHPGTERGAKPDDMEVGHIRHAAGDPGQIRRVKPRAHTVKLTERRTEKQWD